MLTDDTIISLVQRQLDNAIGSSGSDTIWDTERVLDAYHGRKYGTEVEGRSQVVTREVFQAVEWAMPSLLRIFTSGERVVEFVPSTEEDVDQAAQESDYVNHVFLRDNPGWAIANDWMRSALTERNAYVKVTWDTKRTSRVSDYSGLTMEQLEEVLEGEEDQEVELLEMTTRYVALSVLGEVQEMPEGFDPEQAETEDAIIALYDVSVRVIHRRPYASVDYVPREQMRISKDVRGLQYLDEAACTAHVRRVTRSSLIEMGYDRDIVASLSSQGDIDAANNTIQYARQTERSTQRTEYQASDESMEMVELSESYIWIDEDEDGVAELRRIVIAGGKILEDEEVDQQPFVALCPMPQPGAHVGMGYGDVTQDLQIINTHLMRGILDNLALTNNPEKEVVWDQVQVQDDLLQSVVGGIKRVFAPNTITPLTVPFTAGASVPIMELVDKMAADRTGVTEQSKGVDADVLVKSTVGAFAMAQQQSNQRLEMVARTFAETGWVPLFSKIRALITKHQDQPRMVRLRGKYVEVDPRDWDDRLDTTAMVGIGTGSANQQLTQLSAIAEKQEEQIMAGSPLVTLENLHYTYTKLLETAGYKDTGKFFQDPTTPEFQQRMQQQQQQQQAQQQQQQQLMMQQFQATLDAQNLQTQKRFEAQMAKMRADYQADMAETKRKWAEQELEHQVDVANVGIKAAEVVPFGPGGRNG